MTLCVTVTTADGLAMGADSMTSVRASSQTKYFSNADKVFEISGLPIVAMTYGQGAVGRRSISSLVEEWADQRPAYEKEGYTVEQIARDLCDFVFSRHREFREFLRSETERHQAEALAGAASDDNVPYDPLEWITGLVIGGYQPNSRYPWLFTWEEPDRTGLQSTLSCVRPHEGPDGRDGPVPGVNYWGATAALDRLYRGFDGELVAAIRPLLQEPAKLESAEELAEKHRWPIVFEGMPLQDAADMVRFLLEVGCGFERFKEGIPQIGGELDIAVVARRKIHWPTRKPMTSALSLRAPQFRPLNTHDSDDSDSVKG